MKKVKLNMNEQLKYDTIKNLVDNGGNKDRAAIRLNVTRRTVDRLIAKYSAEGKAAFVHGNRGRKPAATFDDDIKKRIIDLYINEYSDANIAHFTEIVREDFNISISDTTINNWLKEQGILSPKAHGTTRRRQKKKLKDQLNAEKSVKKQNEIKEKIDTVSRDEAHPRRPRCKYEGEMIQMDASSMVWVEGCGIWHLHLAIDDATGKVVGAYFDTQETLVGYYNVLHQILINYGIPYMFYTDRRTVFEYKRKNAAFDDEDTFTQFSYACHILGIEIKTTSIAQAKGRIERLNQTFQSRLPVDLRRAGITDIDAANEFLASYLKKYNDQHAMHPNGSKSVYEKQPSEAKINRTLAVIDTRVVQSGHCIKYKNSYYAIVNRAGDPLYFKKGEEALIINCFDGKQFVNINDKLYLLKLIPDHETYSKAFDHPEEVQKEKVKYIPPIDHPWRIDSWKLYNSTMKKRLYGDANV